MKLLCIDSNSILNRAFYGIKLLSTKDGVYTNAIFGYMNIFKKLLDEVEPDAVACAFDLPAPTFRHKMFDGYKAQRKGMPDELAQQMPLLKDLLSNLGYRIVTAEGYEADDILGTYAQQCRQSGDECVIATGDRDSLQLVSDATTVLLASTKGGKPVTTVCDLAYIRETYGVEPGQLIDVKALMGDASDNIPGVAGIGEKGAVKLISEFGSIQAIYDSLDSLPISPKLKEKLSAGKQSAFMSRELAEICRSAPLPPASECVPSAPDYAAARALLSRLQMFTLIERLGIPEPRMSDAADAPGAKQEIPGKSAELNGGGLPPLNTLDLLFSFEGDDIVSFAADTLDKIYVFSDEAPGFNVRLRDILESDTPKRIHDIKRLYRFALRNGVRPRGILFDVGIAGYLLSPNSTEYSVQRLADEYGIRQTPVENSLTPLCRDAAQMTALCDRLQSEIHNNGLDGVLNDIELPLARVLASMELTGFAVDAPGIEQFGRSLDSQITDLEQAIYRYAAGEFNINSPKQLGEVLFDRLGLPSRRKNKSGFSTDAEVLESIQDYHPIVPAILDYRKLSKLKSTYVDGLLKVVGEDGRIRSSFRQTETRTGRISSTEPNMQNIPVRTELGSNMRRFFVAGEGSVLVDADYSQIELRVLAHIANDRNMIEAFESGEDIHARTAAQVFDMPPELVTPQMRSRAKAVNFGIVYGIGAFSLSKDIGVTVAEADRYIKSYLATFDGVRRYMSETVEKAQRDGYVTTLSGRRRYLPELHSSNKNIQNFGKRVAMNTPIQGTAADIIKIAMVRVYQRLERENLRAKLILQVHDELIVEAPEDEAGRVSELLRQEMENAAALSVQLKVDLNMGKNWYDAK